MPPRDDWEGYARVKALLNPAKGLYVDSDFLPTIQPGGYYIPKDGDTGKVAPPRHAFWKEYYKGVMQNVGLTVWLLNEARSRAISARSRRDLGDMNHISL